VLFSNELLNLASLREHYRWPEDWKLLNKLQQFHRCEQRKLLQPQASLQPTWKCWSTKIAVMTTRQHQLHRHRRVCKIPGQNEVQDPVNMGEPAAPKESSSVPLQQTAALGEVDASVDVPTFAELSEEEPRKDSRATSVLVENVNEVKKMYETLSRDTQDLHHQVEGMASTLSQLRKENQELREKFGEHTVA